MSQGWVAWEIFTVKGSCYCSVLTLHCIPLWAELSIYDSAALTGWLYFSFPILWHSASPTKSIPARLGGTFLLTPRCFMTALRLQFPGEANFSLFGFNFKVLFLRITFNFFLIAFTSHQMCFHSNEESNVIAYAPCYKSFRWWFLKCG